MTAWWREASHDHAQRMFASASNDELCDTDHDRLLKSRWGIMAPGPRETWRTFFQRLCLNHFRDHEMLCGGPIPARWAWSRLACLALLLEEIRPYCGPITIRSMWRPERRNKDAGGATWSAHLFGCAVDCDCADTSARDKAWPAVRDLYHDRTLEMGLGLRTRGYHIDVLSPAGHRRWMYRAVERHGKYIAEVVPWDESREPKEHEGNDAH